MGVKVLGKELSTYEINDNSVLEFRDSIVTQLETLYKEPFAMNSFSESRQVGQQECLKDIINFLKEVI